ncbi:MAG: 3'(2'),5'-bisphosphate nucleotidase CysQ [Acidobacteria bacterium]|nr:3'(2'),5'-bisphosphate nucleotidase CysQ [Acidobacteriota bacterium]MCI0661014.1 3'(2'),5'-bisphosphate nucleotidase CysQ [Acidobacteriota bacterium]
MEKELEIAKGLAREAGRILLEYYQSDTQVQWKGHDDPVTAADRAANEMLVRELHRQFPHDAILSEEFPDDLSRLTNDRVWMVDPMDGTKQFIERNSEFAVMIGLAIEGEAKLGVVYHPSPDRMFYAAPGIGTFVEEKWTTKRLRVGSLSDPSKMTLAMSRSHHSSKVDLICEMLGVTQRLRHGSVGLKFGLIAEGRAHLYIHLGMRTNQWDTCGPEVILREAGGVITDITGKPLIYNRPELHNLGGIVASNGVIHDRILETIAALQPERRK